MARRTFPFGLACGVLLAVSCGRIGYDRLGVLAVDDGSPAATSSSGGLAADTGASPGDAGGASDAGLDATVGAGDGTTPDAAPEGAVDAPVEAAYPYPPCAAVRVWSFVFDADPTQIDWPDDGGPEWVVRGGGSFPVSELEAGVWLSSTGLALDTRPLDDFPTRVLIDVRMRSIAVEAGQHGAVVWINMNEGAPQFSAVFAALGLDPDGGQTLSVWGKSNAGTEVALATFPGLVEALIDVHLDVDPVANTVGVWIDGAQQGTYPFPLTGSPNVDHFATLISWGGTSEFQSVEIQHCAP